MTDYDCCVCWHINVDHHHHYYYYLQCTKYDKILFTLFRLGILAVQKKYLYNARIQYFVLNYMVSIDLLPSQQCQAK